MFKRFCNERKIKTSTVKGYETTIKSYTEFHNMTIDELINEAIRDETNGIDKRNRAIRNRLLSYRTFLLDTGEYTPKTIKLYLTRLKTLYNHYQVEIPVLPRLSKQDTYETNYFDLPNKEHIKQALKIADPQIKAVILFIANSGTGLSEVANITVYDFIQATSEYHNIPNPSEDDIQTIIDVLYNYPHEIIPTFYIKRVKTSKYYYTFCTNEATRQILTILRNKKDLCFDDLLFGLNRRKIQDRIRVINDKLNFGFKGKYRFFRPHTLRKFNASNIGLSEEHIDAIQGRSKDSVHETYIKTNPRVLRKIYMNAMDNVKINAVEDELIHHQEFNITINVMLMGSDYGISL